MDILFTGLIEEKVRDCQNVDMITLKKYAETMRIEINPNISKEDICLILSVNICNFQNNTPVKELKPGLYVSSRIVDGKCLHFGLQTKYVENWINYAKKIDKIVVPFLRSTIHQCRKDREDRPELSEEECIKVISDNRLPKSREDQEEIKKIVNYMYHSKRGLTKQLMGQLQEIKGGTVAATNQNAFAWISTEPIIAYREFGDMTMEWCENRNLTNCYFTNLDMIVSVGVWINNNDKEIAVRGIFRPPHQLMYGEISRISLMFHGFIAYVGETIYKKDLYYIPDPTYQMADILKGFFYERKPYRGVIGSIDDLFVDRSRKTLDEPREMQGKPVYIKTKALKKLYTDTK